MNSGEYFATIEQVKREIKSAQYRAAFHVNAELVLLYHSIGCVINEHKEWGNKFIDSLAADLHSPVYLFNIPTLIHAGGSLRSPPAENHLQLVIVEPIPEVGTVNVLFSPPCQIVCVLAPFFRAFHSIAQPAGTSINTVHVG